MTISTLAHLTTKAHPTLGVVYFLQVETIGPIKIGFTRRNTALRVSALQQASPFILNWIGCIPAKRARETELHDQFAAFRLRGEWFHPAQPVRDYIQSVCPDFDAEKTRRELLRFDLLTEVRSVVPFRSRKPSWHFIECLEKLGIPRYDFWCWQAGTRSPSEVFVEGVRKALQLHRETYLAEEAAA